MPRGGREKDRDAPERRCVVSGERGGKSGLIRFVLDPEGAVVPDLAERLPGRGVWVTADRASVAKAARGAFSRGFKAKISAPQSLPDAVEAGLARRCGALLSLARKAGLAVCGFEKSRFAILNGPAEPGALVQASDGAEDGRAKLRAAARAVGAAMDREIPVVSCLSKTELGLAFGRDYVIHAALMAGELTSRFLRDSSRLQGFREISGDASRAAGDQQADARPTPSSRLGD